ncbi:MAG: hypothetical protein MJ146_02095 [Clostridia bacterium]|nr:hypothetical protein [Clostridia bacterium]
MKKVFNTLIKDFVIAVIDILLILFSRDFLRANIPAPFDEAVYLAYFIALILLGFIMYAKISALLKGEKLIISTDERPYRCTGKTVCDNPGCTLCSLSTEKDAND